ncbi:hypothetical protein ONZ51_g13447 [Trametes cubensis]|uniref:Uncharacterized protein n=1 Tax=Trametes cubensis TaxID=1111947 RepID=A0AAD7TFB2_9APHY|nr:hypothetical protein ONZ51_g13447 [Trametes cubensis]
MTTGAPTPRADATTAVRDEPPLWRLPDGTTVDARLLSEFVKARRDATATAFATPVAGAPPNTTPATTTTALVPRSRNPGPEQQRATRVGTNSLLDTPQDMAQSRTLAASQWGPKTSTDDVEMKENAHGEPARANPPAWNLNSNSHSTQISHMRFMTYHPTGEKKWVEDKGLTRGNDQGRGVPEYQAITPQAGSSLAVARPEGILHATRAVSLRGRGTGRQGVSRNDGRVDTRPETPPTYGMHPPPPAVLITPDMTAAARVAKLNSTRALRITPCPGRGWPIRQPMYPGDRTRHADLTDRGRYIAAHEKSKLMFEVVGMNAKSNMKGLARRNMASVVTLATGEGTIAICTPMMPDDDIPDVDVPTIWWATGLSEQARRILLEYGVWATPKVSFFAIADEDEFPTYLFTVDGFARNDPRIPERIKALLKTKKMIRCLENAIRHERGLGADVYNESLAFIDDIEITVYQTSATTFAAKLVAPPPTRSEMDWQEWRDAWASNTEAALGRSGGAPPDCDNRAPPE